MRIERGRIFFMEVLVGEDMRRILRGFYPMLLGLLGLWVLMCLKVSSFPINHFFFRCLSGACNSKPILFLIGDEAKTTYTCTYN